MEKIGLYGGTFAPPHYGHIHAVKTFLDAIPVDRLLIMPTFLPPHSFPGARLFHQEDFCLLEYA